MEGESKGIKLDEENEEKETEIDSSRKKLKSRGFQDKKISRPTSLKEKQTQRKPPNHYHLFRKNLSSLQEAFDNHQFDLGAEDIKKEDVEVNHEVEFSIVHMRTDWGDGTSGENEELLDKEPERPISNSAQNPSQRGYRNYRKKTSNRKGQHYVESATGFFKLLNRRPSTTRREVIVNKSSEDVYERYYRNKAALDPMERTIWICAQGLLAGFTSAPVMLQWCTTSDLHFISSYRRISSSMRRILFLLSLVAAVGALDTLKQALRPNQSNRPRSDVKRWKERSREERILLWLAAVTYLCVLTSSLICSVGDTVISYRDNYDQVNWRIRDRVDGWKEYALEVDKDHFKPILNQWYDSNAFRFTCAFLGWLVVSRLHFLKLKDAANTSLVDTLSKKLANQTEMYRRMKGEVSVLERMSLSELQRLHEEQDRASGVTEGLLRQINQRHPKVAMV